MQINIEKERKEILTRYRKLLKACRPTTTREDKRQIRKAFNLALEAHKDARRKSGEPYIYHPIAVAQISVEEIGLGATSIICALLHDVVEDTDYTLSDIENLFGEKVAKIIDGLTKISGIFDQTSTLQAENFRKMLLTLSDDVRVILIKLADRLHNMRTLDSMPKQKQLKIASETNYLYAPLAHRLGLYAIKSELEDLAFKYIDPEVFENIHQKLIESNKQREILIDEFKEPIEKGLKNNNINYEIYGRIKSVSSIWKKMKTKQVPFEEVYDVFAIRIIVDSPIETEKISCWRVYSVVTDIYHPRPDRLRDWLSTPKANGYESLHTTVMSHSGKWVEIQIRSKRMNEIAEKGYAAHWKYKDAASNESGLDKWLQRIRDLLKNPDSTTLDFLDDFKLNLFSEEIFVFSPKGELRTFPQHSTALDFAYGVHSTIGNHAIGAKINHKLVPLNTHLKSGDQIEIITSNKQKPSEEWLNYVNTARAKERIKDALKEERKTLTEKGKNILEERIIELKIKLDNALISKLITHFKLNSLQDLYYFSAIDKISLKDLKNFVTENERSKWLSYLTKRFIKTKSSEDNENTGNVNDILKNKKDTLLLGDDSKINYKLSSCCSPILGDEVFGYVTNNNEIQIHRNNCEIALGIQAKESNRVVKAKWTNSKSIEFLAGIEIKGIDELGIINNITKVISNELNLNIRTINVESINGVFKGEIRLYIQDTENLKNLINNIKTVKGVKQVKRINV